MSLLVQKQSFNRLSQMSKKEWIEKLDPSLATTRACCIHFFNPLFLCKFNLNICTPCAHKRKHTSAFKLRGKKPRHRRNIAASDKLILNWRRIDRWSLKKLFKCRCLAPRDTIFQMQILLYLSMQQILNSSTAVLSLTRTSRCSFSRLLLQCSLILPLKSLLKMLWNGENQLIFCIFFLILD